MKKFVSLALVFVLMFSMCSVASANSTKTHTVTRNVNEVISVHCPNTSETFKPSMAVAGAKAQYRVTYDSKGTPLTAALYSYVGTSTRLTSDVSMTEPTTVPLAYAGPSLWSVTAKDFKVSYTYYSYAEVDAPEWKYVASQYHTLRNKVSNSQSNLSMTFYVAPNN